MDESQADMTNASAAQAPHYGKETKASDIEADIDHTRAEMDETLDELGRKLDPAQMFGQTLASLQRTFGAQGRLLAGKTLRKIEEHPVPALLAGAGVVGLIWLLLEKDKPRGQKQWDEAEKRMYGGSYVDARTGEPYAQSYGEEFREEAKDATAAAAAAAAAASAGERASEAMGKARHWAGKAAAATRETAEKAGSMLKDEWCDTRESIKHRIQGNPLALSLAALSLGVMVGLLLPAAKKREPVLPM